VTASALDDRLDAYRELTADAVVRYVPIREPRRHLYDPLRAYTMRGGKGLRPALCLAACEAFGGEVEDALPSAAAVELLHTAFLIHDDIEDGSETRRGRSTMHVAYGVPLALNAGDALATLCFRPLLDNVNLLGSRMSRLVTAEFHRAMESTVEGQAIELGWRAEDVFDLTPVDYLDMVLRKTCAYTTILPLRVGALTGSWGSADLDSIARFGFLLGAAFQIQDDVLDLVSEDGRYGKDVLGDVREGKRTLILLHLVHAASAADREFVVALLRSGSRPDGAVRRVAEMMRDYGSIDFATAYAATIARSAAESFDEAFAGCPPSSAVEFLREIIPFMIHRSA
jgi:geranylgeranyl diphosphate synthase type II